VVAPDNVEKQIMTRNKTFA